MIFQRPFYSSLPLLPLGRRGHHGQNRQPSLAEAKLQASVILYIVIKTGAATSKNFANDFQTAEFSLYTTSSQD